MTPWLEAQSIRILHLEDSVIDHQIVVHALKKQGLACTVNRVETLPAFEQLTRSTQFDLILADYRLPGFTAIDAWNALQQQEQQPPFVLLSGAIGEAAAVDAIRLGFSDYLLKDDINKLAHVIARAIEVREIRQAKERADKDLAASERRLAELAEHLQSSIEQERAAIAREVHDDIGGSLAAVKLDLAWLARHHKDVTTAAHIGSALEMLQHALGASQRIMMDLRPPILDQGLSAAVQWLAQSFQKRTGISTTFHATHEKINVDKAIQLVAYRTAQEALTNISKHAECSAVSIELTDGEGVLTLEVTDNGRGVQKSQLDKPKAFGLRGLHERAKTVQGWLDISNRGGVGTSIILSVPLPSETADPANGNPP
ncbi:Signal transduction histidine kinase [Rhodoferax sp. OV413]|uniref:hybrid sensor histidine kinase/response regulator n=1 Tax=Rhodoferax sp. OV413 TaxID=1855285 RepID=UPI0008803784|nr:response regulator [Rhodoferax sp. OV413]SDP93248.1 Signal transduction histidine kinase [Rhodoferax sp. OV413]